MKIELKIGPVPCVSGDEQHVNVLHRLGEHDRALAVMAAVKYFVPWC